jgi:hypothetical protein
MVLYTIMGVYILIALYFARHLVHHPEGSRPLYWLFVVLWPVLVIQILFSDED